MGYGSGWLSVAVVAPETVSRGERIQVEIRVANPGDGPVPDVKLRNSLSPGLRHSRGEDFEVALGTLAGGKTKSVKFWVSAFQGGPQTCAALVTGGDGCRAAADTAIRVNEAALVLALTGQARGTTGQEITLGIEVANAGTASATNVRVALNIAEGAQILAASEGGTHDVPLGRVIWGLGELPAQQAATFWFRFQGTTPGEGLIRALAHAEGDLEARAEIFFQTLPAEPDRTTLPEGSTTPGGGALTGPSAETRAEEPEHISPPDTAPRADANGEGQTPPALAAALEGSDGEAEAGGPDMLPDEPPLETSPILEQLLAAMEEEDRFPEEIPGAGEGGESPRKTAGLGEQHIVFSLAGTDYAVPIGSVLEISRPQHVTPLPHVPPWLLGLTNLRGDIISLVDLRGFLGLGEAAADGGGRLLVVRSRREDLTTCLVVDRVKEILRVNGDQIAAPAAPPDDPVGPYLRGVSEHQGRLLVFLDLDRLLHSPEMRQFESA
jgi:purine-binding chemotaxis protein CheW